LNSLQLLDKINADIANLMDQIEYGEFAALLSWLRVHASVWVQVHFNGPTAAHHRRQAEPITVSKVPQSAVGRDL
jgi:hypothetical protein